MIKRGYTQKLGMQTQKSSRFSPLMISNKDPEFDYAFRRKSGLEENGGTDYEGFSAVNSTNHNGESWGGPKTLQAIYSGNGSVSYLDTVLCKRPKAVSKFFKSMEDEKYNAQVRFIHSAAKRTKMKLRQLDPGSTLEDNSKGLDSVLFTQRPGPNEEEVDLTRRGRPKKE